MNQATGRGRRDRILVPFRMGAVAAVTIGCAVTVAAEDPESLSTAAKAQTNTMNVTIKVGARTFAATLEDNALAKAFKAMLPVTIRMTELNGNEKYFRFSDALPTSASNPGTIHTGDLMIYGRNTLVVFYKTFSTSYSYTRLGRINGPAELAAAIGTEDVTLTFELPENAKGNGR